MLRYSLLKKSYATRWVERSEIGSETKNNNGEQLTVKVPLGSMTDYGTFQPMLTSVEIVDIEKAVVYGEYRNQLSLTAKVIEVVEL